MIPFLIICVAVFLLIVSYLDIKTKEIPSMYNTGAIFVVALMNTNNFVYGFLALIFAWLLLDAEFFSGIADVKMTILIGLMITSLPAFTLFCFLILLYGVSYKIILVKVMKSEKEIAFIPVYFISFVTLLIIHYANILKVF